MEWDWLDKAITWRGYLYLMGAMFLASFVWHHFIKPWWTSL